MKDLFSKMHRDIRVVAAKDDLLPVMLVSDYNSKYQII